jgi:hypothetical protein
VSQDTGISKSALQRWQKQPGRARTNWLVNQEHTERADAPWQPVADRLLAGETPESIAEGAGAGSSVYSFLRHQGAPPLTDYRASVVNALLNEVTTSDGGHDPSRWSGDSLTLAARVRLNSHTDLTVEDAVMMEGVYRGGATPGQIARRWSISPVRVHRVLARLDVDTTARGRERDEVILDLRASGLSIRQIAQKASTSTQTVWRVLKRTDTTHQ